MTRNFLFPVSLLVLVSLSIGILQSCGSDDNDATENRTGTVPIPERVEIGNTGYSILLLDGYYMEPDTVFDAYYFKPVNADENESEAGIYVGAHPDTGAPLIEYQKSIARDTFLNDSVTWIEYTTAKYTQREVFIEKSPEQKIHIWCYSRSQDDLNKLYQMVRSIR